MKMSVFSVMVLIAFLSGCNVNEESSNLHEKRKRVEKDLFYSATEFSYGATVVPEKELGHIRVELNYLDGDVPALRIDVFPDGTHSGGDGGPHVFSWGEEKFTKLLLLKNAVIYSATFTDHTIYLKGQLTESPNPSINAPSSFTASATGSTSFWLEAKVNDNNGYGY